MVHQYSIKVIQEHQEVQVGQVGLMDQEDLED